MKRIIILAAFSVQSCISIFVHAISQEEPKYSFGFMDSLGKMVLESQFEGAGQFKHGLAPVKKNGLWGYINRKGEVVIPFQFKDAEPFSDDPILAPVEDNNELSEKNWGYIDQKGEWVVKPSFYNATVFRNGVAEVVTTKFKFKQVSKRYDKYYLTKDFKLIYSNGLYSYLAGPGRYAEGLLASCKDGKWGFKDTNDTWIIPPKYTIVGNFSEGLARVQITEPSPYNDCELIQEEEPSGLWGYIDKTGKEVIPLKFRQAEDFYAGLAVVDETYKARQILPPNAYTKYLIDKQGKNALDLSFKKARSLGRSGYLLVGRDEKNKLGLEPSEEGIIDRKGNRKTLDVAKNTKIFDVRYDDGDFLKITFQLQPIPEKYEHTYISRYYYTKDLTQAIQKDFPPCFGASVHPPNCMTGNFTEGLVWIAK